MDFLNKYITKKNLFYVTLVTGVLALIATLMIITLKVDDISQVSTGLSSIIGASYLFVICFVLNIIMVGGTSYLYFYKKDKKQLYLILFVISLIAFVLQICTIGFVMELQRIASALSRGDIYSMFGFDDSIFYDAETKLKFAGLAMSVNIVGAIYFGYLKFIKKYSLIEDKEAKETGEGINIDIEALKENANVVKDKTINSTGQLINKFKVFAATKKGKSIIAGCLAVVLLISALLIYNANRKTDFDATRGCEIVVEGISGEGYAYVSSCELDYDITNKNVTMFANNITYDIENNGTFKNGDKVKVVAKYSNETANSLKLNVINTTLTTKVKGLIEYYNSLSDIPSSILKDANKQISDLVNDDLIDELSFNKLSSNKDITFSKQDVLGKYFMKADSDSYRSDSIIYLYKLTFSGEERTSYFDDTYEAAEEVKYICIYYSEVSSNAKEEAEVDFYTLSSYSVETDEEAIEEVKDDYYNYTIEEIK